MLPQPAGGRWASETSENEPPPHVFLHPLFFACAHTGGTTLTPSQSLAGQGLSDGRGDIYPVETGRAGDQEVPFSESADAPRAEPMRGGRKGLDSPKDLLGPKPLFLVPPSDGRERNLGWIAGPVTSHLSEGGKELTYRFVP